MWPLSVSFPSEKTYLPVYFFHALLLCDADKAADMQILLLPEAQNAIEPSQQLLFGILA